MDGEWRNDSSQGHATHVDPSTGRPNAEFVLSGAKEVAEAVAAAKRASRGWRRTPADEKRRILLEIARGIREDMAELTLLSAMESGRPVSFRGQAPKSADWFEYYAGWADKLQGAVVPTYPEQALNYTLPEPYGVIGVIIPWNGPLTGVGRKVAPALAAGNTVVLKPPPQTPFTMQKFGEICDRSGLPAGVLNIVTGGAEAGQELIANRDVGKVTFTGGPVAAQEVMRVAADTFKPLTLELGGKSANIVFEDADLAAAAAFAAYWGAVQSSGQGCVLPTRLLVQDSIYDDLVARLLEHIDAARIGDPLEADVRMGPVIDAAACERIQGVISAAISDRAGRLVRGGQRLGGELADGYFLPPTVFQDVDASSELAQNEVFGPVLSISSFHTADEAVELANSTRYGLAAYIHTRNLDKAHSIAAEMDAGYVSINGTAPMAPTAPFGGRRDSGYGREGGLAGIEEFVSTKNVHVSLGQA